MPSLHLPGGGTLHYEARGHGRPIVFVHGWSASGVLWNHQVEDLQRSFRTIAYDQRGHGASTSAPGPYTMAAYSGDLAHLLRALDLDDVVLVGWSMGYIVALDYFRRFAGERVGKLVLLSGSPRLTRTDGWPHGFEPAELRGLGEAMAADRAATTRMFLGALLRPGASGALLELVTRVALDVPFEIAVESFQSELEADLREVVPGIDVPTLLVHGDSDHPTCVGATDYMLSRLPAGQQVVLPRCGHFGPLEAPGPLASAIQRFGAR